MKLSTLLVVTAAIGACSVPISNVPTSRGDWNDLRDMDGCASVMVLLPTSSPAACPNRLHFAPGDPIGFSDDGKVAAYFCVCAR